MDLFIKKYACLLLLSFGAVALAQDLAVTYGDIMLEEEPTDLNGQNQMSVFGGYDLTNPYLNTYDLDVTYTYSLHTLVAVGIEGVGYASTTSNYNRTLNNEIGAFGISENNDRPTYGFYAIAKFKLLQGRVNVLSSSALPFHFNLKVGTGELTLQDNRVFSCTTWGVEPQLFLSSKWAMALKFDQDLQGFLSRSQTIYRNRASLGATYVF